MAVNLQTLIQTLHILLELNQVTSARYQQAAEAAGNSQYRDFLEERAQERSRFVAELDLLLISCSGMQEAGHPMAAQSTAWRHRAQVSPAQAPWQSESITLEQYERALQQELPGDFEAVLRDQRDEIVAAQRAMGQFWRSFRDPDDVSRFTTDYSLSTS